MSEDTIIEKAMNQVRRVLAAELRAPVVKGFFHEPTFTASYVVSDPVTKRAAIVDNNIKTAAYNVASLREALATQLQVAGNKELSGKKVADKEVADIRQRHDELQAQLRLQAAFEHQRKALEVEIAESLARYRELKGIAPAESGASAAPQG